jgi:hypothetical protein
VPRLLKLTRPSGGPKAKRDAAPKVRNAASRPRNRNPMAQLKFRKISVHKHTDSHVPLGSPSVYTDLSAGSWEAMGARQLIEGASFEPDALKLIGQAFDAAWQEIADNFGSDQEVVESARLRLANAVLSIADEDSQNVEALKRAALLRMALDYQSRGVPE